MTFFTEDWTLQIAPVLLEDDALFQCQVTPGEKEHHPQNINNNNINININKYEYIYHLPNIDISITKYEYIPPTKYKYNYNQI